MAIAEVDTILDINTLEQYCSAIGAGTLLKSVVLFEQLMPDYVNNLVKANKIADKDTLCAEAHKFKGAAGSIGLRRIQQYSQLLQHGDAPEWQENHEDWLAIIVDHSEDDLHILKHYLENKVS